MSPQIQEQQQPAHSGCAAALTLPDTCLSSLPPTAAGKSSLSLDGAEGGGGGLYEAAGEQYTLVFPIFSP